ncbi:MAG: hypothetical protein GF398_11295 [Chitinivibrionales bacterium]|nr:hypothetical protein [Chitinivibrionales bacterium]
MLKTRYVPFGLILMLTAFSYAERPNYVKTTTYFTRQTGIVDIAIDIANFVDVSDADAQAKLELLLSNGESLLYMDFDFGTTNISLTKNLLWKEGTELTKIKLTTHNTDPLVYYEQDVSAIVDATKKMGLLCYANADGMNSGNRFDITYIDASQQEIEDLRNLRKQATTIVYSDGLGRGIQAQTYTDNKHKTNTGLTRRYLSLDSVIINGIYFDEAGRKQYATKSYTKYLNNEEPEFVLMGEIGSDNLSTELNAYYDGLFGAAERPFYAETRYYDDPLGRHEKTGAPGSDFSISSGNHAQSWYYGVATDDVTSFAAPDAASLASAGDENAKYAVTATRDPNGAISQTMTDIFGNTVKTISYLDAAGTEKVVAEYEYDLLGNLTKEVPPQESSAEESVLASTYKYNTLGQVIEKYTPDRGTEKFIYDDAGRLKFSQNERQKAANALLYINYDFLGRITHTGVIQESNLGNTFDTMYVDPNNASLTINGNTANSIDDLIVMNVYDDANNLLDQHSSQLFQTQSIRDDILSVIDNGNLKGNLAASIAYNQASSTEIQRVTDLFGYDDENRMKTKFKIIPGQPVKKFQYTYNVQGNVLTRKYWSDYRNPEPTRNFNYQYDKMGRLKLLEGGDRNAVVQYDMSMKGQLQKKSFGLGAYPYDYAEIIGYSYNVRDWLSSMATSYSPDSFAQDLYYTDYPATSPHFTSQYNGNVAAVNYKQKGASTREEKLLYQYDRLNRLTKSKNISSLGDTISEGFAYYHDGRIRKKRKGSTDISAFNEVYKYYSKDKDLETGKGRSNRLAYIAGHNSKGDDDNYDYDANGNMIYDKSKKMTINYDWRDMPTHFQFHDDNGTLLSEVIMLYDAAGNRVVKTAYDRTR